MQLSEIGFETINVLVRKGKGGQPDQHVTLRGISADDLMKLFRAHGPDMIKLFNSLVGKYQANVDDANIVTVLLDAAEQAPDLIADLIVLAADTPAAERVAAFNVAKRLPVPVQLKALQALVTLTLEDFGGVGELVETITHMTKGVNGLSKSLLASPNGSAASDVPSASLKAKAS